MLPTKQSGLILIHKRFKSSARSIFLFCWQTFMWSAAYSGKGIFGWCTLPFGFTRDIRSLCSVQMYSELTRVFWIQEFLCWTSSIYLFCLIVKHFLYINMQNVWLCVWVELGQRCFTFITGACFSLLGPVLDLSPN